MRPRAEQHRLLAVLTEEEIHHELDRRARRDLALGAEEFLSLEHMELPPVMAVPHLWALAGEAGEVASAGDLGPELDDEVLAAALHRLHPGAVWRKGPRLRVPERQVTYFTDPESVPAPGGLYLTASLYAKDGHLCGFMYTLSPSASVVDAIASWHWHPPGVPGAHLHLRHGDQWLGRLPGRSVTFPEMVDALMP